MNSPSLPATADASTASASAEEPAVGEKEDRHPGISLPSGDSLSTKELSQLFHRQRVRIVALVGDRNAGKTTIPCSIFDQFCKGPISGYTFEDSLTIPGFERRLHYTRAHSGAVVPDIPHTPLSDEAEYLHLAIRRPDGARVDLAFPERAGEGYKQARLDPSHSLPLPELQGAFAVCFVINGELLVGRERSNELSRCRMSLDGSLASGCIAPSTAVYVVVTKRDKFPESHAAQSKLDRFMSNLARDYAPRVRGLHFRNVSVRTPVSRVAIFAALLDDWTGPSNHRPLPPPASRISHGFDRLGGFLLDEDES